MGLSKAASGVLLSAPVEVSEPDLHATLAGLAPPPAGHVHLFRIQSASSSPLAPWLQEALAAGPPAQGRWFTDQPETLAFCLTDTPSPALWVLTVPAAAVASCRVSQLPAVLPDGTRPRAYSRAPEDECFVPSEWLQDAWEAPWQTSPPPSGDQLRKRRRIP